MNFAETKQLLQQYYNLDSEKLPQQREKSNWEPENSFGFLRGIIAHGLDNAHLTRLHSLLQTNQFQDQEQSFIDCMFDYYIRPFHKGYTTDSESCHTPPSVSSKTPSRSNSKEDLDYVPEEKELSHNDLKTAVLRRDGVCLFCWNTLECEGAHIIAQKNIPMAYDESPLLQRAGLTQKHQVQNGLLLCPTCHGQFDKLKMYVDVVDDKLVVKVVNETNDPKNEKHKTWMIIVEDYISSRRHRQKNWSSIDKRKAVETNGEMALYFIKKNSKILPNRNALEFHKAACLIWRMAGGAEPDDEYCSLDDDDLVPVDTAALKRRFNIHDSAETLYPIT